MISVTSPRNPSARRDVALGILTPVAVAAVALGLGLCLVATTGASVAQTVNAFWVGAFGSSYAVGASLNRAVPFALVGLGFILAARANLTNVGGEGQIAVGGIFATASALHGAGDLPLGLSVLAPLLAGALAGAVWGGLSGWLKVWRGTNEVISSLLLSFIAVNLVYWCVSTTTLLRRPQTTASTQAESLEIPDAAKLPLIGADPSSPLHAGFAFAALAAIVVAIILAKSAFGLRLKAIGLNPLAARRAGVNAKLQIVAMALAGALGGIAGATMIQGDQYVLKIGFSSNYGFDGIVVGLLSRGSALGVVVGALFFAFLRSGGMAMEMMARVPSAVVWICQGLIVVAIAGASAWIDGRRTNRGDRK